MKSILFVISAHKKSRGINQGITGPERRALKIIPELRKKGYKVSACYPAHGAIKKELEEKCNDYYDFEISSKYSIHQFLKIKEIIAKSQSSFIFSHGPAALDLICALACYAANKKHIISRPVLISQQINYSFLRKIIYQTVDLITLNLSFKVISITSKSAKELKSFVINKNKVVTIYNGVKNHEVSRDYIQKNNLKIIMAAQFSKQKGWENLVQTVSNLKLRKMNVEVYALGDGPEKEKMIDMVREFDVEDRFIFKGLVKDVMPYLLDADIFILTSYREGMSVAILEAMMSGLPIISSDVGGIREQIRDGKEGYIVQAGDIEGYTEAVIKLDDHRNRSKFGISAMHRAKKYFSQKSMVDGYFKILE